MIPPLPSVRLPSIQRWMLDSDPSAAKLQPAELRRRVESLDEQMIGAFGSKEDSLMFSMMATPMWGTEAGLVAFRTDRLMLWSETVSEFLPETSDQPSEG